MKTVLALMSSLNGANGESTKLIDAYIQQYKESHEAVEVIYRDLSDGSIPHLTIDGFSGFATPENELTAAQKVSVDLSKELIKELQQADIILVGLPLYNFGVPSTLKAWIDHVARAGITFQYGSNGPEGLLTDKQVIVMATRGGQYAGTPGDTQTPFVKQVLGFIGLTDVEFIFVEGLARSGDQRENALQAAQERITALTQA